MILLLKVVALAYRNEIVETGKLNANDLGGMKEEWYHALEAFTNTGAAGSDAIFTVTGLVEVFCFGHITTVWTSTGDTLSIGTADSTALIIAATAGSAVTDEDVWTSATMADVGASPSKFIINDGDIMATESSTGLAAGVTDIHCYWRPLEEGASVIPIT